LKISFNKNHESKGYGFVCFEEEKSANACLAEPRYDKICIVQRFKPRDSQPKRMFNNLYVKNFPDSYVEQDIRNLFSEFGTISSLKMVKQEKGG
jgi:polyadenylate-binding protein